MKGKKHFVFVKKPSRIDACKVLKSLSYLGFDQYLQVEKTGWVLYLEGATDFQS